jgi:hypothetical protein
VNSANYPLWAAMSIVDGSYTGYSPTFNYQHTQKHGWLCQSLSSGSPNNSGPEGKFFYDKVHSTGDSLLTVTGVESCQGAEGIAQGTDPDSLNKGAVAVENDMNANCQ